MAREVTGLRNLNHSFYRWGERDASHLPGVVRTTTLWCGRLPCQTTCNIAVLLTHTYRFAPWELVILSWGGLLIWWRRVFEQACTRSPTPVTHAA